jgi:hypothetical protein
VAYSGGSGTQTDPYQIADANNWTQLKNTPAHWNKHFLLTADINLAGVSLTPVGNSTTRFTGVFDGNNHVICNAVLNLPSSDRIGLFGFVDIGSQVKNLGVVDPDITGRDFVGALVGYNCGAINLCYATGTVHGRNYVGGLVGCSVSSIISSYAVSSVGGNSSVGGLVGLNGGSLTSCYAATSVTGTGDNVGGLVGGIPGSSSSITLCYATGSVVGNTSSVGGLVGGASGTVTACYSTASVDGTVYYVGGLIGYNNSTLTSSYATGSVDGGNSVGGLVGWNDSDVASCYAAGTVTGDGNLGGLVGVTYYGTVNTSFWDTETSGQSISSGGTGKTTDEMKTQSTFTDADWDFVGEILNGTQDIWRLCTDGTHYPQLSWYYYSMGDFKCPDGVNFKDYAALAKAWQSSPGNANWNPICDISDPNDSVINNLDLTVLCENWLEGVTP